MAFGTAIGELVGSSRLVFANRNLRRINLGIAGSMIGDWAYATAISVLAFRWGGPVALGTYLAVRLLTIAVALPFLSTLADKLSRVGFLVCTDLIRLVLVAVAAVMVWAHWPTLVVLVVSGLTGLVGAPFRPAQ